MRCPWCQTSEMIYEWMTQWGEKVAWWRCIICGHRVQDYTPDQMPENPLLKHPSGRPYHHEAFHHRQEEIVAKKWSRAKKGSPEGQDITKGVNVEPGAT